MNDAFNTTRTEIIFNEYKPSDERRREALLALGNGVLSMRASAPELSASRLSQGDDQHYPGFYRAGWYDDAPRRVNGTRIAMSALVNLPDPFGLTFALDDDLWFNLASVKLQRYRQVLSLDRGTLRRDMTFMMGPTREVRLSETRLVSMADPDLCVLRWEVYVPEGGCVRVRSTLNAGVRNAGVKRDAAYEGRRLQTIGFHSEADGGAAVLASLHDRSREVAVAAHTRLSMPAGPWQQAVTGDCLCLEATCDLPEGRTLIIEKYVTVRVEGEIPRHEDSGRTLSIMLDQLRRRSDFDSVLQRHAAHWHRLWGRMAMQMTEHHLALPLRLHRFHVLQALSPNSLGQDMGWPARGWQEGYFGQIFWDEIFAVPFLATHFPELAHTVVNYRYARLDMARALARRSGYRGAMFPWRSGRTGGEETPPYQCNPLSHHWVPDHTYLQRHVGSAIAYDVWQLYLATGDRSLVSHNGGELILEIARFWASMVRFDPGRGRYVIEGVIGPDEYHNAYPNTDVPGLDNNAYTNVMASWVLALALELLDLLPDEEADALQQRLGVTPQEQVDWDRISRTLYVPVQGDGVISQFEGFDRLESPPPEFRQDGRPRLDWMLEAQGDKTDNYQLTKQADVLMLLYLFPPRELERLFARLGYIEHLAEIRRTADYYLARITHESSLSKVVCAGALARLDAERSWDYFRQSLRTDLDAPSDSGIQEGVHLGAMAGSLDVLQRHYLGIVPNVACLQVMPAPPAALDNVSLDIEYKGVRLNVALKDRILSLSSDPRNSHDACIEYWDNRFSLKPGQVIHLTCR